MDYISVRLKNLTSQLQALESNVLIVLRGFPLSILNEEQPFLEEMLFSKFSYFAKLIESKRRIILYEEFICLYDFLVQEFRTIHVIDNNCYINLYPLYAGIDNNAKEALRLHYDVDSDDDNIVIGDLVEYTNIYSNFVCIEGVHFAVFNESTEQRRSDRVMEHSLFEAPVSSINYLERIEKEIATDESYVDILDETDYVSLLRILPNRPERVLINLESCAIERSLLVSKLQLLIEVWGDWTEFHLVKIVRPTSPSPLNRDYAEILKKFWNADAFKPVSIYDFLKLQEGVKEVVNITQEVVIADLVSAVEDCRKGTVHRDVFVTAPTGAGKSAMFQIPAIYIAEKYQLVTLVISPLIGLMNDQVKGLEVKNYMHARTINSDISPVVRQEIINEVACNQCHILYLSPESLLSRSDIEQLIGERTIGMIIVDEAHIVTTWGKQFRPDYWYLGDHIRKLRKAQITKKGCSFVVGSFTATAIYGGLEDMYRETVNSLHMLRPHTYLGFVKRSEIEIAIKELDLVTDVTGYELGKFEQLVEVIVRACCTNKKTLIYFPTVALIERFHNYCYTKNLSNLVTKYHGQMDPMDKRESYERFLSGERMVMFATKAFGMGIDIDNIEIVSHFAPTGNVCDYVQEIGRAARQPGLCGEAIYAHMKNDFKHINRLHGLSTIRTYQLVEVIKKVYDLYLSNMRKQSGPIWTKKRHSMLVDAESFAYIFDSPLGDDSDVMNKVKTAMLIVQKDYENRFGFSPFAVRPIPLFATGFFSITTSDQKKLNSIYEDSVEELVEETNVCKVNLRNIWEQGFQNEMSFPKFKYLLYTKNPELSLVTKYALRPALSIDVTFSNQHSATFQRYFSAIRSIIDNCLATDSYYSQEQLAESLGRGLGITTYRAGAIVGILIAAMDTYKRSFAVRNNANLYIPRPLNNGSVKYRFNNAVEEFLTWIERGLAYVERNIDDGTLFMVNEGARDRCKEYTTILGVLEALGVLTFKSLGGANSQIYIYVNQTKTLQMVANKPHTYKNRLLESVGERHHLSVEMMSFLFQNEFDSQTIWDYIEDYFLGRIPEKVKDACRQKYEMEFDC